MTVTRRDFVRGTLAAGTAAASGLVPIGCGNDVEPAPIVSAESFEVRSGGIELNTARFPDLVRAGGSVTLVLGVKREPGMPEAVLLVHRGTPEDLPEYMALNSACPHLACPLGYSPKSKKVECPCHASRFEPEIDANLQVCSLSVDHAPALSAPQAYGVEKSGNSLRITFSIAQGGRLTLDLADPRYAALASPGGVVVVTGCGDSYAVIRESATAVKALSAICTHLACTVDFNPMTSQLDCPCHGSKFRLDGSVVNPPATQPLASYPAELQGNTVVVTVS